MILFLVLLFGFAAVDKMLHAPGFVRAINSYRIIPIPMGNILAPVVVAAELAVALGLIWKPWRATAALQGGIMMGVFTVGLINNRLSGEEALCGCSWHRVTLISF